MNRLLIVTVLSLFLLPAVPALAEESKADLAKVHFKKGQAHFEAEEYADALRAFKKAHKLHPLPDIVFMVGQAQRNLKLHGAAAASYRKYLEGKQDASDKEEVERLIEELEFLEEAEGSAEDPTANDPPDDPPKPAAKPKSRPKPKPKPRRRAPTALTPGPKKDKPIYKKWWFWVAVGGGLAVAGGTAGIVAWQTSGGDNPEGSLGTLDLP